MMQGEKRWKHNVYKCILTARKLDVTNSPGGRTQTQPGDPRQEKHWIGQKILLCESEMYKADWSQISNRRVWWISQSTNMRRRTCCSLADLRSPPGSRAPVYQIIENVIIENVNLWRKIFTKDWIAMQGELEFLRKWWTDVLNVYNFDRFFSFLDLKKMGANG